MFLSNLTPAGQTATTSGTIGAMNWTQNTYQNGGTYESCQPQASYSIGGVKYITSLPGVSVNPCPYSLGQTVTVHYDPSHPRGGSLPSQAETSIIGIVFFVVGLILAAFSVGILFGVVKVSPGLPRTM